MQTLGPILNRCRFLKLPSSSKALYLAQTAQIGICIQGILKHVFKGRWYIVFLYLDGMLSFPLLS